MHPLVGSHMHLHLHHKGVNVVFTTAVCLCRYNVGLVTDIDFAKCENKNVPWPDGTSKGKKLSGSSFKTDKSYFSVKLTT
jgi:hypothetical protein